MSYFVRQLTVLNGAVQGGVANTIFIPTSTYADLPAGVSTGTIYQLTDTNRGRVCWNGTQWVDISNGVFNAYDFNVPMDGASDCGPAINDILSAIATNGYGKILFGSYTHIINTAISWPTNCNYVTWEGQGKGLTSFVSTFNGGASTTSTITINAILGTPITNITFRDCTFSGQGNSDAEGAYQLFYFGYTVNQVLVQRCEFFWAKAQGIHISSIDDEGAGTYGTRFVVDDCYFHDIGTASMSEYTSGGAFAGAALELVIQNNRFENIGLVPNAEQNNFHAVYIVAQCDVQIRGNYFVGLCSRLHMYSNDPTTEPAVTSRPALIENNTFDGIYGGSLANAFWNCPGASIKGNAFYNTGVNIGNNDIDVNDNKFYVDSNVPVSAGASFLCVTAGTSAANVGVCRNTFISMIPHSTAIVWPVYMSEAGSNEWTVDDNIIDSNINNSPTPYDIAGIYFGSSSTHFARRNRIRSHLNATLILLGTSCGGGCRIEDNTVESNTTSTYQPFWDASQNPSNVFVNNKVNSSSSAIVGMGVIAQNWDGIESSPTSNNRMGQRCFRNLSSFTDWTPGTISGGLSVSTTVLVSGAVPGDAVLSEFGAAGGVPVWMFGRVTNVNTATVWAYNGGSGNQVLPLGNLHVTVRKMWPDWGDGTTPAGSYSGTWNIAGSTTSGYLPTFPNSGYSMSTTVTVSGNIGDAVAPKLSSIGSFIIELGAYMCSGNTAVVTVENFYGGLVMLSGGILTISTRPS